MSIKFEHTSSYDPNVPRLMISRVRTQLKNKLKLLVRSQKETPSNTTYCRPGNSSNRDVCISTGRILQLCKVSSVSVHPFKRSCAYTIYR